jgi:hypothetical protein
MLGHKKIKTIGLRDLRQRQPRSRPHHPEGVGQTPSPTTELFMLELRV